MFRALHHALSHIISSIAPSERQLLNDDVLLEVFSHLQPADLARAALVCSRWDGLVANAAYTSILFDTRNSSSRLLARTLRSSERILAHIRHITIIYCTPQSQEDLDFGPSLKWLRMLPPHNVRSFRCIGNHRILEGIFAGNPTFRTIPRIECFLLLTPSVEYTSHFPLPTTLDGPTIFPVIRDTTAIVGDATISQGLTFRAPPGFSVPSSSLSSPNFQYLEKYFEIIEDRFHHGLPPSLIVEMMYSDKVPIGLVVPSNFVSRPVVCGCEAAPASHAAFWDGGGWDMMLVFVYWQPPFTVTKLAEILHDLHAGGRFPYIIKVHAGQSLSGRDVCETCGLGVLCFTKE